VVVVVVVAAAVAVVAPVADTNPRFVFR
jgi:hypothetical protein